MSTKMQGNGGPQTKMGADAAVREYLTAAVARLAYEKWQARGWLDGDDERDWFEAEQELLAAGPAGGAQPRATANSSSGKRA